MNERIQLLMQLISTLSDAAEKLEASYNRGEISKFESIKKEILTLHQKIKEV